MQFSRRTEIPEERAMKRVTLMLVFLALWSVAAPAAQPNTTWDGAKDVIANANGGGAGDDAAATDVVTTYGVTDNGSDGDPGDAGDGYGFAEDIGSFQAHEAEAQLMDFIAMLLAIQQELFF